MQRASKLGGGSRLRLAVIAALLALPILAGAARSLAASSDTFSKTTVQERIVPNTASGFRQLQLGPGENYTVRQELGAAQPGRAGTRTSMVYFGQLSDFQLVDEESPARVEFVDPAGSPVDAAWRPWEALEPQIDDAMVRKINNISAVSPLANGNGTRSHMDFTIDTGDSADSMQLNETRWVRTILEGGTLDPNSGVTPSPTDTNPLCAGLAPLIADGSDPGKYTGVQDYNDYTEGPNPYFYDPDQPTGLHSDFPTYTGLMDAAQKPFVAAGLDVPSYVAFGNHDALVQGNQAANSGFENVATGCIKPFGAVPPPGSSYADALSNLSPATLLSLAPSNRILVPPDPARRFVSRQQFKAVFQNGSQPDGHGFDFIDPAQNAASGGSAGYYSWSPVPKLRFVALDTTCEGGIAGPAADGNIDDAQFQWLRGELTKAQAAGEYVVLFSHHAIQSLTCNVPDEAAPPCSGADGHTNDGVGHDSNPGCDVDPRNSSPIHLGADATALLHQFPNVIAWVAGHSHLNDVTAYPDGVGGGFWMIRTAAEADWPQQSRLIQIFDNHDGTLSIFGTILDHASTATAPASVTNPASPDPGDLASIGRTLAYNDKQVGARECSPNPCGEGAVRDRNVELLLRNPLPKSGNGALGKRKGPCANRQAGGHKRDRLRGTRRGDRLLGRGGRDKEFGLAGRDCLKGQRGGDRLKGGAGADRVAGGRGPDKLSGGKGRDTLMGGSGSDRIRARGGGRDKIRCGAGLHDVAIVDRRDRVRGCELVRVRRR